MSPHIHSCPSPPPPPGSFGSLLPYLSHQDLFLKRGRVVAGVYKQEVCPNPRLAGPSLLLELLGAGLPLLDLFRGSISSAVGDKDCQGAGDLPLGSILILFLEKALQESWEVSQLEMGTICYPSALWHTLPCGKVGRHGKMVPSSTQPISLETIHT